MNLFTRIYNLVTGRTGTSAAAQAWLQGRDMAGSTGAEMSDAYTQGEIVYACVQALAENVSGLPWRISRIGRSESADEDILQAGPAVELFKAPHPDLTRFDLWELIVVWLHLRGAAYLVCTRRDDEIVRIHGRTRGDALPERLVILPTDRVQRIAQGNVTAGYRYSAGNDDPLASTVLLPEEVLRIRLPGLAGSNDTLAPAIVSLLAAQGDYAAAQYLKGLWMNNADQGLIVSSEQWLSDEQRAQVLAALRERKRKAGTADRPLLLGGGLRVERPPIGLADTNFIANRDFNRKQICAIFRVPENILGFTAESNRSVGIEQRANFTQFRIAPLCERLADSLRPIVQCFGADLEGWWDIEASPAMVEVRRSRFASARASMDMGIPLNDLNEVFDLGLPKYDWGDRAYIPFSLQEVSGLGPLGEPEPEPGQNPSAPPSPADAPSAGPHSPSATSPAAAAFLGFAAAVRAQSHVCIGAQQYAASIRASVLAKKRRLSRFFWEQRARVLSKLDTLTPKESASVPSVPSVPCVTQKSISDLWDEAEEDARLAATIRPTLLKDLDFGGSQVWRELGLGDAFAVKPMEAITYLAQRSNMIKGINDTTFGAIRDTLTDGLSEGDTYQDLVKRVKSVFSQASQSRAETIALTETNIAVNTGRYQGMAEAGVEKKAWLSSNLENSRPTHQQAGRDYADGIPIDTPFTVGGEKLMHPGDPTGSPDNVINCKCTVLAIVDEKAVVPDEFLSFAAWNNFVESILAADPSKMPQDEPSGTEGVSVPTTPAGQKCNCVPAFCNGIP